VTRSLEKKFAQCWRKTYKNNVASNKPDCLRLRDSKKAFPCVNRERKNKNITLRICQAKIRFLEIYINDEVTSEDDKLVSLQWEGGCSGQLLLHPQARSAGLPLAQQLAAGGCSSFQRISCSDLHKLGFPAARKLANFQAPSLKKLRAENSLRTN
jgi:hypothetical protein